MKVTRRHRIHEAELEPVYEILTNELAQRSREHPQDMVPYLKDIHLFRLWWRIKEGREGKPAYPTPITYGTIKEHVTPHAWSTTKIPLMVPLHSTEYLDRLGGEPQPTELGTSVDKNLVSPSGAGATIEEAE